MSQLDSPQGFPPPAQLAVPPPAAVWQPVVAEKRRRVWPWVLGGCLGIPMALIGLGIAALVIAGISNGGHLGAPSDFPVYAGSQKTYEFTNVGTGGTTIRVTWAMRSSSDAVTAFYAERLNHAPWSLAQQDAACGCMTFSKTDGTTGRLQVLGQGTGARVEAEFHLWGAESTSEFKSGQSA